MKYKETSQWVNKWASQWINKWTSQLGNKWLYHWLAHLFTHWLVHLLTYWYSHLLPNWLVHLLTHWLAHLLTHLFVHLLTYSFRRLISRTKLQLLKYVSGLINCLHLKVNSIIKLNNWIMWTTRRIKPRHFIFQTLNGFEARPFGKLQGLRELSFVACLVYIHLYMYIQLYIVHTYIQA